MLTVACLNAGNYMTRGQVYTEKLHRAVARHLTLPHRFVVFTDDGAPYADGIDKRPLPDDRLSSWWHKISLFKPGAFADGERVVYIDLDSIITGTLDDLFAYDGVFCMLAPFFDGVHPVFAGNQSGLMSWTGGTLTHIWKAYEGAGFPELRGGDQAFINALGLPCDTWQALYPGRVFSYKAEGGVIPEGAAVCCCHGIPRPHQITSGWVPEHWR